MSMAIKSVNQPPITASVSAGVRWGNGFSKILVIAPPKSIRLPLEFYTSFEPMNALISVGNPRDKKWPVVGTEIPPV